MLSFHDLQWEFTSLQEEVLSLNLQKAYRACEERLSEGLSGSETVELGEEMGSHKFLIESALSAHDYHPKTLFPGKPCFLGGPSVLIYEDFISSTF